jgi:cytochrome c oxidase cbb3-type subunit 1
VASSNPPTLPPRATPAELDAACRGPVLTLLVAAVGWLVSAGALALLAAIKLHAPGFLAGDAWLACGRVSPAATNAFAFGFATQAGLGFALWLIGRLGGAPLAGRSGIIVATFFWNLGLAIGVGGLLLGDSTGLEGMELPRYATPILAVAGGIIVAWTAANFLARREPIRHVAEWYLLGALAAFPWLFATATLLTGFLPLRGVVAVAAAAWYLQNLLTFWLGFLALAALFHFLPQLTGAPVPSRSLAVFGFWSLVLVGGAAGLNRFHGGPFPAWMISVSVVASVLALVPTLAVARNLFPLLRRHDRTRPPAPALTFFRASLAAFTLAGILGAATAGDAARRVTQFTLVTPALDQLTLWGFIGLAMLGAMHDLVPRLAGRDWPSARLARWHRRLALAGVTLLVGSLGVGGVMQGLALNQSALPFFAVVKRTVPFLGMATLANLILLTANCLLAVNVLRLLAQLGREHWARFARVWLAPLPEEVEP